MIKIKTLATTVLCLSAIMNSSNIHAQTFECEGKKIVAEGKKIVEYKESSGKGLSAFVAIRQDSIIYKSIKTNPDESLYMIQKFHFFIGDVLFTDMMVQRAFYPKKVEERTISVVSLYAFGNQQLDWYEEMLCGLKKFGLYRKQGLELFFDNDADAKEFFTKIKAIYATLPPKETTTGSNSVKKTDDKSATSNYVTVFNDMGKDMYVKKDMDPMVYTIAPNASHTFTCKLGEKVSWCEKNSTTLRGTLFTISDQMIKDKTIKLSSGTKK